jgi:hypothetical protein
VEKVERLARFRWLCASEAPATPRVRAGDATRARHQSDSGATLGRRLRASSDPRRDTQAALADDAATITRRDSPKMDGNVKERSSEAFAYPPRHFPTLEGRRRPFTHDFVIASVAKQSSATRATLDCRAAPPLAMTG